MSQRSKVVFPMLDADRIGLWDRLALRLGHMPAFCNVCGRPTVLKIGHANLRETCGCRWCGASSRQRQLAYVVCQAYPGVFTLKQLARHVQPIVYNTEAQGPVNDTLRGLPNYECSEFFGAERRSGDEVAGVRHQDLQALSYPDESFDLVLSAEVFEHLPDPYEAHRQVYRVLRAGGRHVFTVPFDHLAFVDDVRARPGPNGPVLLKEPEYHPDPLRSTGALVYTMFGLEMLVKLYDIGFETRLYRVRNRWLGIYGPPRMTLVFEAVKRIGQSWSRLEARPVGAVAGPT